MEVVIGSLLKCRLLVVDGPVVVVGGGDTLGSVLAFSSTCRSRVNSMEALPSDDDEHA
jgi:hypothetical protein